MNEVFFMLRKAFVSITLCAVFLMSPFVGLKVNALSADSISAPSAVLMESSTGKVLFEKNPHEQRPCASVTTMKLRHPNTPQEWAEVISGLKKAKP